MLNPVYYSRLRLRARKGLYVLAGFVVMPLVLAACQYPYDGSFQIPVQSGPRPVAEAASQESVLPRLNNAEDVFRALGVWEEASELLEDGLTPQQVAKELGFGPDKMHRHLVEVGEEALDRYTRQSSEWVEELFPPIDVPEIVTKPVEIYDILPPLNRPEDLFRALDRWSEADGLIEHGLPLWKVARELELGPDRMHERLMSVAEKRVREAVQSGRLEPRRGENLLDEYEERVEKWIDEIFEDEGSDEPIVKPIELDDFLPEIDSAKDVFKVLGVWEKAEHYLDEGLTLEHTARELGYTADSMHERLMGLAREIARRAIDANRIDPYVADELVGKYNHVALEWVELIFADNEPDKEPDIDPDKVLPKLNTIDDVFRFLGMWPGFNELRKDGLGARNIARELGLTSESLRHRLIEMGEDEVDDAHKDHGLSERVADELLEDYERVVDEWVEEIFTYTPDSPAVNLEELLPRYESIEGIFKALRVWEDANFLMDKHDLTAEEAARELDYTPDWMEELLFDIGEEIVEEALVDDLLEAETAEDLLHDYEYYIHDWVEEIFGDF